METSENHNYFLRNFPVSYYWHLKQSDVSLNKAIFTPMLYNSIWQLFLHSFPENLLYHLLSFPLPLWSNSIFWSMPSSKQSGSTERFYEVWRSMPSTPQASAFEIINQLPHSPHQDCFWVLECQSLSVINKHLEMHFFVPDWTLYQTELATPQTFYKLTELYFIQT